MKTSIKGLLALAVLAGFSATILPAGAQQYYYSDTPQNGNYYNSGYNNSSQVYSARTTRSGQYPQRIPIENRFAGGVRDAWHSSTVRSGIVGAGVGVGAAALRGRNLLRGSLIGLAAGAGVGLMDDSVYFQAHPMARGIGKGALIGVSAATITGAAALLPAAAVGAGIGAGVHYLNKH